MRIVDAQCIPEAGWLDAPRTDSPQIQQLASFQEENWPVALLATADTAQQTPDLL